MLTFNRLDWYFIILLNEYYIWTYIVFQQKVLLYTDSLKSAKQFLVKTPPKSLHSLKSPLLLFHVCVLQLKINCCFKRIWTIYANYFKTNVSFVVKSASLISLQGSKLVECIIVFRWLTKHEIFFQLSRKLLDCDWYHNG